MYRSLGEFVSALEAAGELRRVRAKVDPVLEIAQIADVVSKGAAARLPGESARRSDPRFHDRGGHALLFENVEGSDFPLLINAWGSYSRMELALGVGAPPLRGGRTDELRTGFEAIAQRIASLTKPQPPRSLGEMIAKAREVLPLLRIAPRRQRGRGACQEVVKTGEQIDLTRLPIIRCWPLDGDFASVGYPADVNDEIDPRWGLGRGSEWDARFRGRYITLAGIHTIHADDIGQEKPASHNIGMYRVQLFGKRTLSMHWHMHHDGARHWRSWKAAGKRMPVAIVLGGESVMPYAATAPLPPGISELLLAGFLNGRGIPMVRGVTVPLWIPANAEIVIEGFVSDEAGLIGFDPRESEKLKAKREHDGGLGPGAVFEGPFGDHTGFYSMPDRYPLLEVTAITHRRAAIYPTTIVGLPPQEDYYLGKATERVFLPLLKTIVHDIEDYDLPLFGAFHNCACIKVKKAYPLQGRRLMHSVWGAGQMAWTKTIFIVDDDCNVHDMPSVLTRASQWCHPGRDVEFANGPVDILDHSAPRLGAGLKMGLDCTRKREGEEVGGIGVSLQPRSALTREQADAYAAMVKHSDASIRDVRIPSELGLGWMFVTIEKTQGLQGQRVLESIWEVMMQGSEPICLPPFVIILDQTVDLANIDMALFHWVANFDASRDLWRWTDPLTRWTRLGFDATPKTPADARAGEPVRAWPPVIAMDPKVRERVESRWQELFPGARP